MRRVAHAWRKANTPPWLFALWPFALAVTYGVLLIGESPGAAASSLLIIGLVAAASSFVSKRIWR
jgi:hypothetical protein